MSEPNYPNNCNVLKLSLEDEGYGEHDDLEYYMYPCARADFNQEKPVFSLSLPGESPKENIMMGMQGMTNAITIDFYIWDDGEDRAGGTYDEDVISIKEQVEFLLQEMHDHDFDSSWEIEQVNHYEDEGQFPTYSVVVENIRIPVLEGAGKKWLQATIDLQVGETI